jgi:transcription antitermination factor NusG
MAEKGGIYCLYVGNRREKSVAKRLQEAKKARGYSIRVIGVGKYPGYLNVEADATEDVLNTIFRGCGVRRVCGK